MADTPIEGPEPARRISSSGLPKTRGTYWSIGSLTVGLMLIVGTVLFGAWAFLVGLPLVIIGIGGVFIVEYRVQRREGAATRAALRRAGGMMASILGRFASR